MKGRASQLRGAAAVGQEVWGKAESSGSGEARARKGPGGHGAGAQGEHGQAGASRGARIGREETAGRQRGRSSWGQVLRVSRCGLQEAKPVLGGCPPRRGFHPGIRGQDPPEALSGWALELRGVSWWTWGPEGASPP